jgi:hypothetical protein
MAIGVVSLLVGAATLLRGNTNEQTMFWASLMQNSIFFLLICLGSVFILCATSLAQGSGIVGFRRIPEAIAANVWVLAAIVGVVLFTIVLTNNTNIYHWLQDGYHPHNSLNMLKNFFLSKPFFLIWTAVVLVLWGYLGKKVRDLSVQQDTETPGSTKTYWLNFKWSAGFVIVFALSLASTIPWLWIMSIDSKWFSTMFSWYTFASSFVSGMSLIMLWVLYTKRKGYLEIVIDEHIHDIGKFMFAFSVFWTYLWFSQFMLIWYANIPEETVYFQVRMHGPYKFFYWANLIINFVCPILILMPGPNKRNYFVVSLVAVLIIAGHWIDFFQMVMPGTVGDDWSKPLVFGLGLACGFIGLIIYLVSKTLSTAPMVPQNHPFLKETIIHVS